MNSNHSNNTSICSHSRSKSRTKNEDKKEILLKKNPIPLEKMKIEKKLIEFKKTIVKKIKDTTRNKNCKTQRERTSRISSRSKERSLNKSSISNCDLSQKINDLTTRVFFNEEKKKNRSPIKKIPISNCNSKKSLAFYMKNNSKIIVNKVIKDGNGDEIPIVINQSGVPCFNNINIYSNGNYQNNTNSDATKSLHPKTLCSTNSNSNQSSIPHTQMNLRQCIFTKCSSNLY